MRPTSTSFGTVPPPVLGLSNPLSRDPAVAGAKAAALAVARPAGLPVLDGFAISVGVATEVASAALGAPLPGPRTSSGRSSTTVACCCSNPGRSPRSATRRCRMARSSDPDPWPRPSRRPGRVGRGPLDPTAADRAAPGARAHGRGVAPPAAAVTGRRDRARPCRRRPRPARSRAAAAIAVAHAGPPGARPPAGRCMAGGPAARRSARPRHRHPRHGRRPPRRGPGAGDLDASTARAAARTRRRRAGQPPRLRGAGRPAARRRNRGTDGGVGGAGVLAEARAAGPGTDDDELVARHPVLLALLPPAIGQHRALPPRPRSSPGRRPRQGWVTMGGPTPPSSGRRCGCASAGSTS